jgi:hypothetical protein
MNGDHPLASAAVIGMIALSVALGALLVAYLWETLNELLAGQVDRGRILLSLPALLVFALLLDRLSRFVQRLDAVGQGERSTPRPGRP